MVGNPRHPQAPFEMRDVSPRDLDAALDLDRATTDRDSAAPSTPKARS